MDALQTASYKLAEKMYAGAQAGAQAGAGEAAGAGAAGAAGAAGESDAAGDGADVVDADFEVVDE